MATFPEHPSMRLVIRFLKDENAATAIEYAVIAAGITLAIIATVKGVGTKVNTIFSSVSTQLN
jgi:pilus assembly protein Flp/PilA